MIAATFFCITIALFALPAGAGTVQIQESLLVEPAEIVPFIENSLSANPDDAGLHLALGSLYINIGTLDLQREAGPDYDPPAFKSAEKHLNKAAQLAPSMYLTQFHLGLLALHRQDLDGALKNFKKAIELNPRDVRAHQKVHTILITRRQYATATLFLEDSVKALPREADLFYRLAFTYLVMEDMTRAKENAQRAITLGYGPEAFNILATIDFRTKDYNGAEKGFKKVLKIDPSNINAMLGMARLYIIKKDLTQARRWMRKILAIDPQNQEIKKLSQEAR